MSEYTLARYEAARDELAAARIVSLAFGTPEEKCRDWFATIGDGNLRVMRRDGVADPAAFYVRIGMGQYFGGRSVPMAGIAGVAVPPESRGQGVAQHMMRACVRELHEEQIAMSCLYASTQSLYRQVGYEQAGHRFCTRVHWATMPNLKRELPCRELFPKDQEAITQCYRGFAEQFDGTLDRGPYIWDRIWSLRGDAYRAFGVGEENDLEGYVFLRQSKVGSLRNEVVLSDVAFTTARAGRALVAFLADFAMMSEEFVLHGGPLHPLLTFMPQQRFAVERKDYWMLRITHLERAMEARGFQPGLQGQIEIVLQDNDIPEQSGAWRLSVERGRGRAERIAGTPKDPVTCCARGLAAMYSGLHSPSQARLAGLVEGSATALAAATAIFPQGSPWMTEQF